MRRKRRRGRRAVGGGEGKAKARAPVQLEPVESVGGEGRSGSGKQWR